ncbi:MAG: hypothetical protein ACI8P3_002503 [Saprospiraceae bacterium]|jgi:hypothetical protein
MTDLVNTIYWYCTDFCINSANLLNITYVEFNFWLFLVIFPVVTILLLIINVYRYILRPLGRLVKK